MPDPTSDLTISLSIPLSDEEWAGPTMIFYRWIPEDLDEHIETHAHDMDVTVWIDKSCVASLSEVTDDLIEKWVNVTVDKVCVLVEVHRVEAVLLSFIWDERDAPRGKHYGVQPGDSPYADLCNKYEQLGISVVQRAYALTNRLIAYARNAKSQYWLEEYKPDVQQLRSLNIRLSARAKIRRGEWFRWCPSGTDSMVLQLDDSSIALTKDDWPAVVDYVKRDSRPELVQELLANARSLLSNGHTRSAVIEAVTALEVALAQFAKRPQVDGIELRDELRRVDLKTLDSQVQHLGFSGSMRYLVPLLFSESVLASATLEKCSQALDLRNNVVHQGQRSVNAGLTQDLINAVSTCCAVFARHTARKLDSRS